MKEIHGKLDLNQVSVSYWGVHTIHLEITGDFRKSDWLSAVQSIHESYDFFLLMTYFSQLYDFLEKVALHLVQ